MDICCTLVSGSYFLGATALINSLVVQGFKGEVHVGYSGSLPVGWPQTAVEVATDVFVVNIPVETKRFLGYEKPFFLTSVIKSRPGFSRVCWFDSDVVAVAPWSFIQDWIDGGVAVCSDFGFPEIAPLHPWRREWRQLIAKAGLQETNPELRLYPNGGFLGCRSEHWRLIEIWAAMTEAFENCGGEVESFAMSHRWKAVVGDQDLLAAALMCWNEPLVALGMEGMGFTGLAFPLCHGVDNPKPWQGSAMSCAMAGAGVGLYRREFEKALRSGPMQLVGKRALQLRRLDLLAATLVSRFYKR